MCTRFYIEPGSPSMELISEKAKKSPVLRRFLLNRPEEGDLLHTCGEIRPTNIVPVIAPDHNRSPEVYPMRWGFLLPGHKSAGAGRGMLVVNARVETAAQKPSFRDAWLRHRCVVPASCYFEWEHYMDEKGRKKAGRKYAICAGERLPDFSDPALSLANQDVPLFSQAVQEVLPLSQAVQEVLPPSQAVQEVPLLSQAVQEVLPPSQGVQEVPLLSRASLEKGNVHPDSPLLQQVTEQGESPASLTWLCGLYRIENGLPVFVILTREPGPELSRIHDRMPLILSEEDVCEWIRPEADPQDFLSRSLTNMHFSPV